MPSRTITETTDAAGFDTPYTLRAGDVFNGTISSSSDHDDYIAMQVVEGRSYVVTATSQYRYWPSNLRLLAEDRGFITWGNLVGDGQTAALKFVSDTTGVLHVAAGLDAYGVGKYEVTFEEDPSFAPWSLEEISGYLTTGFHDDRDKPAAKWDFAGQGGEKVLTYDASALGAAGEIAAAQAFRAWSDISGIHFRSTGKSADITFKQGGDRSYATPQTSGGDLTSVTINIRDTDFASTAGFVVREHETLMHEIGHALGLGHAGPYNFFGVYEGDALHAADTRRTSAMSYFAPDEEATVDMYNHMVLTPMPADILAIERLYGGVKLNTGDTVYGNDAEINDLAQLPSGLLGSYSAAFQNLLGEGRTNSERYLYTIKDDGGTDTLDLGRSYFGETIDLTVAGPHAPTTAARNIVLMPGTVIENANGGHTGDRIIGNVAANMLNGNAGADWVEGRAGEDRLTGGDGNDTLIGGAGGDTLSGGAGLDILYGDAQSDLVHLTEYHQVYRLYQAVLGRTPDAQGHKDWTEHLVQSRLTLGEIAQGFVASPEFKNRYGALQTDDFVELLYRNVLARAPDDRGLEGWTAALNSGQSRADVVVGFSESREFIQETAAGASSVTRSYFAQTWTDDVFRLYAATLGRSPDLDGLMAWTDALGEGRALRDVIAGFTHSAEFLQTYGDTDDAGFVNLLYRNVLGRDAAAPEIGDWLSALGAGQSREDVVLGFSQSKEFRTETADAALQWVRQFGWDDVLDGGAGANDLLGGMMADRFVFTSGFSDPDGNAPATRHTVFDLEPWDLLDFGSFGYESPGDVARQMVQSGSDVVFSDQAVTVVLKDFALSDVHGDMIAF